MVVDDLVPAAVTTPRTPEQLAAELGAAVAGGRAVVPVGGGRALGLGSPLTAFDLAISTRELDRVLEHSAADLMVTVEAGITLEALDEVLARAGQFLPFDPFAGPGHTIGGMIATGWSGPLRLGYGTARDHLVGMRVALPDGRLVRSGGRVVKNVSGYDMQKLHLGALGSMGVIVEASFKVLPRPAADRTVQRTFDRLEAALDEIARTLRLGMPPVALELLSPSAAGLPGYLLVARLMSNRAAVDRSCRDLGWEEAEGGFWATHRRRSSGSWARVSVPPARLGELLRALPPGARWTAHAGAGVAHWFDAADPEAIQVVRKLAESLAGNLVLLAAPVALKQQVGVYGSEPEGIDVMRALRSTFDPGRRMSPGRFLV